VLGRPAWLPWHWPQARSKTNLPAASSGSSAGSGSGSVVVALPIDAGEMSRLDRYIGYYEPYATSHDGLDKDTDVQEEVRNVARAVAVAVRDLRAGKLSNPDSRLKRPRAK